MTVTINGTTGIAGTNGSAGTPAVQGEDTNTGIFFPAADTVAVATAGAERVRVDSSGNVGIGTTSPSVFSGYTTVSVNNATNGGIYNILVNGTETARLQAFSGAFTVAAKGAATNLLFETNGSERARIDSSGNLLVGTTSSPASSSVGSGFIAEDQGRRVLQIATNTSSGKTLAAFINPNGVVGTIGVSGSSTSYNTSSDYRLKENVQPMTGALDTIGQLNPVTYTWKADGSAGQGFIAHELQAVVPDCVTGEKDAVDATGNPQYQGVDTSFLVATLVAALQEQQALITAFETRLAALEAQ